MRISFLVVALTVAGLIPAAAQGAPLGEESFVGRIDLRIGIAQLAPWRGCPATGPCFYSALCPAP
jgi:hypothetical protein